jgi:hypothetical protein
MRASPRDLYDAHMGQFNYLLKHEPMGLMTLVIHCQFGGRPLITAVLQELLEKMKKTPGVWFARHDELAQWALKQNVDEYTYRSRFFPDKPAPKAAAAKGRAPVAKKKASAKRR